jgi:hypothetical protein
MFAAVVEVRARSGQAALDLHLPLIRPMMLAVGVALNHVCEDHKGLHHPNRHRLRLPVNVFFQRANGEIDERSVRVGLEELSYVKIEVWQLLEVQSDGPEAPNVYPLFSVGQVDIGHVVVEVPKDVVAAEGVQGASHLRAGLGGGAAVEPFRPLLVGQRFRALLCFGILCQNLTIFSFMR